MPTYGFRCPDDGDFDVVAPMGEAGQRARCPDCGGAGSRVFSAPMLARGDRRIVAAMDRADRTRDEPDVVTSIPPVRSAPRRVAPPNPALARLPRP